MKLKLIKYRGRKLKSVFGIYTTMAQTIHHYDELDTIERVKILINSVCCAFDIPLKEFYNGSDKLGGIEKGVAFTNATVASRLLQKDTHFKQLQEVCELNRALNANSHATDAIIIRDLTARLAILEETHQSVHDALIAENNETILLLKSDAETKLAQQRRCAELDDSIIKIQEKQIVSMCDEITHMQNEITMLCVRAEDHSFAALQSVNAEINKQLDERVKELNGVKAVADALHEINVKYMVQIDEQRAEIAQQRTIIKDRDSLYEQNDKLAQELRAILAIL